MFEILLVVERERWARGGQDGGRESGGGQFDSRDQSEHFDCFGGQVIKITKICAC